MNDSSLFRWKGRRFASLLLVTLPVLGGCSYTDVESLGHSLEQLLALLGFVIAALVCLGLGALTCIVGGLATSLLNLAVPARWTRVGGIVFGSLNLVFGGALILLLCTSPPRSPAPSDPSPTSEMEDVARAGTAAPSDAGGPIELESFLCTLTAPGLWALLGLSGIVLGVRTPPTRRRAAEAR